MAAVKQIRLGESATVRAVMADGVVADVDVRWGADMYGEPMLTIEVRRELEAEAGPVRLEVV